MGKLFHGKGEYTDEEFVGEELEDNGMLGDGSEDETNDEIDNEIDNESETYSGDEDDDPGEDGDSDDDEEEEWTEDDRRTLRRRRRLRNQVIAYAVVFVILAALIAGGVVVGRNVVGAMREKREADEQAKLQEQMQAQQEAEAAHEVVIAAPESVEEMEEEPEPDRLGNLVRSHISEMPLEDKVAGLFIVTPESITGVRTVTQAGEGTQKALNEYAVGGLIYFRHNIIDEEQLKEMLSATVSMSRYPIFLAVDEEGGSVSRVADSGIDVIKVGDMASIGESGDTTQAYEAGVNIGAYLKELGFNLDFAPVADVAGSGNSVLGDRIFGSDARLVGDMVSGVVEGLEGTGVSSCLKHFPGIGDTDSDTHDGRVETSKTLYEMRASDFIPFQAGIEAGAEFVMVSHVTVPAVDGDAVPSSLSKTMMTDVLRNELGFQGVIITDALNMSAITEYYTTEEAAVKAIAAGADMLLMPDDFYAAYDAVIAAVQDGTISEERLDESLERIYRVKYKEMVN